jgi:NAD+ kinase
MFFPSQQQASLSIRSVPYPDQPTIILPGAPDQVTLWSKEEGATLTLDGQVSVHLGSGDTMTITKSPHETLLVSSPHRDYLEILRSKFGWGGRPTVLRRV